MSFSIPESWRREQKAKLKAAAAPRPVVPRQGLNTARQQYDGFDLEHLKCYGCAHSAVVLPWPGGPSGERPCQFCIRNPLSRWPDEDDEHRWYDGSEPLSLPMDCYQPPDMVSQVDIWIRSAETAGQEAVERMLQTDERLSRFRKMREENSDGGH